MPWCIMFRTAWKYEITSPATGGLPQQKTEYRLEELREYARERRSYTKHNSAYWHEGGIEAHRSETWEAHLHQMNIAKAFLKHDYSTAGGQLHV